MTDRGSPDRVLLGGAVVHLRSREDVLGTIHARIGGDRADRPLAVASANIDHIHHFGGRHRLSDAELDWLVLLDGVPLVRRAHALTGRRWPQLAGSDLLPDLLALADEHGARVGFLGGTPAGHTALRQALAQRMPGLKVAGAWAPTRAELADPSGAAGVADAIAIAGVDLLVVGLGKPRQELWIQRHAVATGARVLLAFGAAADFLAGTATRAPEWIRRAGGEWAYRLAREPRRLGRRYLLQGPPALWRLRTRSRAVGPGS
jgi:exopolysaccharide biosynthesis WecB/TagA/CpsF family protein